MHVTNQSVVSINIFPLVNWFRKYLWKARSRFNDNISQVPLIDWLYIYYLMSAKKYFYCRWRAAKLQPLLNAYSLWGGRGLLWCIATSAVTWALLLTVSFERPPHLITLYNLQGVLGTYSNLDPHGNINLRYQKA